MNVHLDTVELSFARKALRHEPARAWSRRPAKTVRALGYLGLSSLALVLAATQTQAGPRDTAKTLYERIAGVPPSETTLNQAETLIATGKIKEAAALATADPNFYNLSLKNWVASWTNVAKQMDVPLNDYMATVIGVVRDNLPFDQVLYGDHLYIGATSLVTSGQIAAWSASNNQHYSDLERRNIDLSVPSNLIRVNQSAQTGIADTAGVLTSRASGAAFLIDGTNRRAFRFAAVNFLCQDLEQLQDTSIPDFRVRRDIDRSPGGDSRVFKNRCSGCHGLMDGFDGAFAYFDFVGGSVRHTPGQVAAKYNINASHFPAGFVTTDDTFLNLMTTGRNSVLGWRVPKGSTSMTEGKGARDFGKILAASRAFSSCMVERAFKKVCLRTPTQSELNGLEKVADNFESSNYAIKGVFGEVASFCLAN